MQKFIFADLEVAANDIFHDWEHFWFWDFAFLFEERAKVALLTEFCDDVAVSGFSDDLIASENVGVLEFCECLNFAI